MGNSSEGKIKALFLSRLYSWDIESSTLWTELGISQEGPGWIPQEILLPGSIHYGKMILSSCKDFLDLNKYPGSTEILGREWFNNSLQFIVASAGGSSWNYRHSLLFLLLVQGVFVGLFPCKMLPLAIMAQSLLMQVVVWVDMWCKLNLAGDVGMLVLILKIRNKNITLRKVITFPVLVTWSQLPLHCVVFLKISAAGAMWKGESC